VEYVRVSDVADLGVPCSLWHIVQGLAVSGLSSITIRISISYRTCWFFIQKR